LVLAAVTSSVTLLKISVAYAIERWGLTRTRATLWIGGTAFLLGVPSSLGFGLLSGIRLAGMPILDAVDFLASNILLPLSGLAIALYAGWHWREADATEAVGFQRRWLARLWRISIRYIAPALITVIFLRSLSIV
jgi:NSS family neurotransmitter:Na+ symporter